MSTKRPKRKKKPAPPEDPSGLTAFLKKLQGKTRVEIFLAVYRHTALISRASAASGIVPSTHYRRLKSDPAYAAAFADAHAEAISHVQDVVVGRVVEGVAEPVFYKGRQCGSVQRYSDGLAQFILRGHMPQVYRERSTVEISGLDGGPVPIVAGIKELTDDELDQLKQLLQRLVANRKSDPGDGGGGTGTPPVQQD